MITLHNGCEINKNPMTFVRRPDSTIQWRRCAHTWEGVGPVLETLDSSPAQLRQKCAG
ncbi:MAG: hypothetical protein JWR48_6916 [Mycobacterium sp.]|nr:hypothetical protein [Mycobacterium sp.]